MRRVALLALLALALPIAASANTIDYSTGGYVGGSPSASVSGTLSVGGSITVTSTITQVNFGAGGNYGTVTLVTGPLSGGGGNWSFSSGTVTIATASGTQVLHITSGGLLGNSLTTLA